MKIEATIPAYQAVHSIGDVVERTLAVCERVLVVDDGSTDGTADAARAAGAEVVSHPENLGKGRALRTAFSTWFERGADAVLTLDADGQHLPEEIPRLLAGFRDGGHDLVLGTREHLFTEMSRLRRTSNRLSSLAISIVAGRPLPDVQTGFRIYGRALLEDVGFPEPRFEAESAVVVRAARRGWSIAGIPVRLGFADGRSTSHYRPLIDSGRIFLAVSRARLLPTPTGGLAAGSRD